MSKKFSTKKTIIDETPKLGNTKINQRWLIILFLVAFAIYGNSILNKYALDDMVVIVDNDFIHQGIGGIKDILLLLLYRSSPFLYIRKWLPTLKAATSCYHLYFVFFH